MTDFKASRRRLKKNLNILEERAARLANNVPLDLLTQIEDHQQAIALTDQAIAGKLSEGEWQEAIQRLNVSLEPTRNILQVFVQAVPVPYLAGVGVALFALLGLGVLSLGPVQGVLFPSPTATITPTFTPTATPTVTPTPTPAKLTGDFNIAIAQFQVIGQGEGLDDATQLAQNFTNALQVGIEQLIAEITVFNRVEVASPAEIGPIPGETDSERAANALALAEARAADVVIYGTVEVDGLQAVVQPQFYVNISDNDNDQFVAAAETTGVYRLGKPLETADVGDRIGRSEISDILVKRFQAITFIIHGLAHFDRGSYAQAEAYFKRALEVGEWDNPDIIYVWLGNTAIKSGDFSGAESHYRQALAVNDKYSRAYGGLAQTLYLQVLEDNFETGHALDLAKLTETITVFQQALDPALEQPPLANVPTRVTFGLGQAYLLKADALLEADPGQEDEIAENYQRAFASFETVIEAYKAESNPRLAEIAAYAHANLGAIYYYAYGYLDEGIAEYEQALELLSPIAANAITRSIYEATLGDIYVELQEPSQAGEWYTKAIENAEAEPELQQEIKKRLEQVQ